MQVALPVLDTVDPYSLQLGREGKPIIFSSSIMLLRSLFMSGSSMCTSYCSSVTLVGRERERLVQRGPHSMHGDHDGNFQFFLPAKSETVDKHKLPEGYAWNTQRDGAAFVVQNSFNGRKGGGARGAKERRGREKWKCILHYQSLLLYSSVFRPPTYLWIHLLHIRMWNEAKDGRGRRELRKGK